MDNNVHQEQMFNLKSNIMNMDARQELELLLCKKSNICKHENGYSPIAIDVDTDTCIGVKVSLYGIEYSFLWSGDVTRMKTHIDGLTPVKWDNIPEDIIAHDLTIFSDCYGCIRYSTIRRKDNNDALSRNFEAVWQSSELSWLLRNVGTYHR